MNWPDILAFGFFAVAWSIYAVTLERAPASRGGLNAQMDRYREEWIDRMLTREMRMVDMQIMAALQNGTAFFATTTIFAIGGALTLLRSTSEAHGLISALPFGVPGTPVLWEIKTIGLTLIFVYAFFKFAWSYRLFNYVAILFGAMPFAEDKDTVEAKIHVRRTVLLFQAAGRHFNRGQRAFFFALGYLGWFVSPWFFLITTAAVVVVMRRRQFSSDAALAMVA
ncbi:MAG: DUF599 family protein [Xanthobacteraceae bacterium]|nr:MAG: DUF599 family protein [Xanthobacteraceae bacterium]